MSKLKKILLSFVLLLTIAVAGVYFIMRQSLPPMAGQVSLTGLSQDVKIQRDQHGIPHIFASNKLDAMRALGYVIASERLFQMEIQRRLVYGELSEIFGPAALPSDRLYRTLMLKKSTQTMLENKRANKTLDEAAWAEMEAYYDGVNQYIKERPLPYEFTLLGLKPQNFSPIDGYAMTGYMAYSFGVATKADVLLTKLSKTLEQPLLQLLRPDGEAPPLQTVQFEKLKSLNSLHESDFTTVFDGSNGWLIAPSRSKSGKSILANDPHIGFSLPGVWFEAHIKTPEYEFYGHHLPLIPFPVIGHSPHHGWGLTMSVTDDMDLYAEQVDHSNNTYMFKGKVQPLEVWQEEIKIKKQVPELMTVKRTLHGPLMDAVLQEKNLALKWLFHDPENDPVLAFYRMASAKSMAEFKESLKLGKAPGLSVMYADSENIAWWMFGDITIKNNPNSDFILDGASGNDEYLGTLPFEAKPHSENPPEGVIVTANSKPPGMPSNIKGSWQSEDRKRSIEKLLAQQDKWGAEEFKALQNANYNYNTENIHRILLEELTLTAQEKSAFEIPLKHITSWNQRSTMDSIGATIFHQWNNEILNLMLKDWSEEDRTAFLGVHYSWSFFERVLFDANSPWWKNQPRSQVVTEAFRRTISSLTEQISANSDKWQWSKLHTIEYGHPLGKVEPLNFIFNLGPYPIPGAYNEINNNKQKQLGKDFKVSAGPSTRRIIDFANPKTSYGILPVGNSGHMLSPFYKDQLKMFIAGDYRHQLMDEKDIEKNKKFELILKK